MTTTVLPLTPAVAQRLRGRPLVLLLDIDGTLSPLASMPEQAVVPEATRRVLVALAAASGVFVVAVSGRGVEDARRMVGVDGVWFIGNHGMELGVPGETAMVREDVAPFESAVADAAARASETFAGVPGVIIENKRWTLSVHYRQVRDRSLVPRIAGAVEAIANARGLKMTQGKEVLELRPPVAVHKGTASIELAARLGALDEMASLLSIGDDRTDEDMFRALRERDPRAVTVRVARGLDGVETAAEFRVRDTHDVRELLSAVLALRR